MSAALCISVYFCGRIENSMQQRESTIAGKLINSGLITAGDISAFVQPGGTADMQAGAAALKSLGYSGSTAEYLFPFAKDLSRNFITVIALSSLLFSLLSLFFVWRLLGGIYRRIDETADVASRVGRGSYNAKLPENAEGAFGRLSHAFNEMSGGVSAGIEKLNRERVFLKDLISDISHQLKTPISALKMYNEIILAEDISSGAREFTEKSGTQIERMEWLVLGLLKMARLEAGCLEMELRPGNLTNVVSGAVEDYIASAKEKNIEISVEGTEAHLMCDESWLREAVGNVLKNCIEYTPHNGRITLETGESPVTAFLKISDTGQGISPEDLPHIFKRFYRGRHSSGNGSGIGLSLAKSITEQMGGTITAGSVPGKGSVFTFSFLKKVI